jgi:ketosteroid isomerase-like protein
MSAAVTDVVRRLFEAVEARDLEGVLDCYDEAVEIHESPALPYGGVYRGRDGAVRHALAFVEAWGRYQTRAEVRMDPRFAAGDDGVVTVVFRHRAADPRRGERLDEPEVSVYEVRDGRIVRSQMFHADPSALARFLDGGRGGHL